MDHRDLHHILKNLSAKLSCPHCKVRISGQCIKIINIFANDCVFTAICPHCQANMVLGAHLEDTPSKTDLISNVSSQITTTFIKNPISAKDIQTIKKGLICCNGSFKKMFKQSKK